MRYLSGLGYFVFLLLLCLSIDGAQAQENSEAAEHNSTITLPSVDELISSARTPDDDLPTDFAALSELRSSLQRGIPWIDRKIEETQAAISSIRNLQDQIQALEKDRADRQDWVKQADLDIIRIEDQIASTQALFDETNDRQTDSNASFRSEGDQQTTTETSDPSLSTLHDELFWAQEDKRYYDSEIAWITSEIETLQTRINDIGSEDDLKQQLIQLDARRINYERAQVDVDLAITRLLMPEVEAQKFKTWVSIIFAALVGFVIFGFFYIAAKDTNVRRTIFSGDTGIQFITLFAIIIAIILFGITGILEDKELAAILAAIAGYILGRTQQSIRSNEADPPPGATPAGEPA